MGKTCELYIQMQEGLLYTMQHQDKREIIAREAFVATEGEFKTIRTIVRREPSPVILMDNAGLPHYKNLNEGVIR